MTAEAFRRAVEASDLAAIEATLAPDIVFHTPIKFRPFEGREMVMALFGVLLETLTDFRYTDELAGHGTAALVFSAKVGDREIEGLDLLRFGADGLIDDFTVMVRPLTAAQALAEAVGRGLGLVPSQQT